MRGTAPYAYEADVEHPAYCHPVQATIAAGPDHLDRHVRGRGRRRRPRRADAPRNAERLASTKDAELAILQDAEVAFRGQLIGVVVAETSEVARHAAELVRRGVRGGGRTTSSCPPTATTSTRPTRSTRDTRPTPSDGDVAAAMAAAEVTVEQTYTTAMDHNNPLEPHTTTALWDAAGAGTLTLWDSTQGVHGVRAGHLRRLRARRRAGARRLPVIGGGFGSKGTPHANVVLAAHGRAGAARPAGEAGADPPADVLPGRLPHAHHPADAARRRPRRTAVGDRARRGRADVADQGVRRADGRCRRGRCTPRRTGAPPTGWPRSTSRCPRGCAPPASARACSAPRWRWTSSPRPSGSTRSSCASATSPRSIPSPGKPWSSRQLVRCLREGARRFGWADRGPGRRRDGDWLVGTGVACSIYPVYRQGRSTATIRFEGGRYVAEIGAADLGTGAWTVLPQIAADALGVPVEHVEARIGDTQYPFASVAGGSSGTSTWGTAARRGGQGLPGEVRRRPGRRRRDRRRGRLGGEGRRPRRLRLRRAVRRGAGERRHRRDPGAAAARGVRRRPDHQPPHRRGHSSSAA